MDKNLDRFQKDLDRLIRTGGKLDIAIRRGIDERNFDELIKKRLGDKKAQKVLENFSEFETLYEAWYSESIVLLKQLLPERVANFISFYEKPKSRKIINIENYVIQDYLKGLVIANYGRSAALPQFQQQLAIIKAVKSRFESSLFDIKKLVQADLFDTEIEAASELLKNGFYRAAGIIAGVVLEKHLTQVCQDHSLIIKKKRPTLNDFSNILKENKIIDTPQWRHISFLSDIRNLCGHNKQNEPTQEEVKDLISGTNKVLKTIF